MEKNKKKIIIAGPCAVEKKEQFYNTVERIYHYAHIIRAGVWKGRTSPKDYSGSGEEALSWIEDVQNKYKIRVAIEVGTTRHVELALQYNIKILWIGARTTVNPFSVQEIAESMRGLDVEVWIKNPIIPDLKLWVGAIERFQNIGLNQLKSIHRGFYSETQTTYRNNPRWKLLKKFRQIYPHMPIISDPSHITGNTKYIYKIAKKACQENVDGLMFEVHNSPNEALSDKKQQLTPKEFQSLLKKINNDL